MIYLKKNIKLSLMAFLFCLSQVAVANLTDDLLAHYPFDGNANDESGNSHNGVVNGVTLTEDRNGKPNSAYQFGNGNYIQIDSPVRDKPPFSISLWVRYETMPNEGDYIIANGGETAGSQGISLLIPGLLEKERYCNFNYSDGAIMFAVGNQNTNFREFVIAAMPTQKWNHVVATWDEKNQIKVYINSQLAQLSNVSACSNLSAKGFGSVNDMRIGLPSNINKYFLNGKLDDIRIYKRVLSEQEVQEVKEGANACTDNDVATATTATVKPNLDIHLPSLNYQSLTETLNLWADFEYYGLGSQGELLWKLKDYGENKGGKK